MEIVGNVNITGAYNINNRNVIADTSNYILSTSNILVGRINANSGGGSGSLTSGGNLTLSNNATSNTVLSIANSNVVYGTIQGTSNYTSNVITTGAPFIADFSGAGNTAPSVHEAVSGSTTERIMIFRTANVNHTFTVPTGGLVCDILMIGGGGAGLDGGGGGAGACVVSINKILPAGSCVVNVGAGGAAAGVNGGDSFIQVANADRYRAKGGGTNNGSDGYAGLAGGCGGGATWNNDTTTEAGGAAVGTNVVTLSNGFTATGGANAYNHTELFAMLGNAGGNNGTVAGTGGSGGGIGATGVAGGNGGNGKYDVTINSQTYNFRNYFANGGNSFGVQDGSTGNYYIGGGGSSRNGTSGLYGNGGLGGGGSGTGGTANTGSGGGGGYVGGSGIIIIRYLSVTTTTTPTLITITIPTATLGVPTIELIRGTQGDNNLDYKLGNYDGNFKIMSSISSIDTDRLSINSSTNSTALSIINRDFVVATTPATGGLINALTTTGSPITSNIGTTDRYMIFTSSGSFTVPTGGINCDILMIGGGGAGGYNGGGGGGAGACIVAINQTLSTTGTYTVNVGAGDTQNSTSTGAGGDSSIVLSSTTLYLAKGGGRGEIQNSGRNNGGCGGGSGYGTTKTGGTALTTNIVNGIITGPTLSSTFVVLGNKGGDRVDTSSSVTGVGGGGIGGPGGNHILNSINAGPGGTGVNQVAINGITYNFKSYFAGGTTFGNNNDGFIGGGGGGSVYTNTASAGPNTGGLGGVGGGGKGGIFARTNPDGTSLGSENGVSGTANTGGGGGGAYLNTGIGGNGGSGIVIVRYRVATAVVGVPSVELIRGVAGDSNHDYKVGNYDGNFKIMSSVSGATDAERINITSVGNVGIGTSSPANELHIFDSTTSATSLIIQNNNMMMTSNTTQGTSTTQATGVSYTAAATPSFSTGGPSASGPITITTSIDKFMIFTTTGVNHTFTVPANFNCDILMIGGGGGQDNYFGGAGAGACIVAINQTLPTGSCVVVVGAGGINNGENGYDSFIHAYTNTDRYRAKGGAGSKHSVGGCGAGGEAAAYGITSTGFGSIPSTQNVVTLSSGLTSNIGPCLSSTFAVLGNNGGDQFQVTGANPDSSRWGSAGGGGIGSRGADHPLNQFSGGNGGNGAYQVTLTTSPTTTINFRDYFANGGNNFGVQDGTTGNYYIGGGGGGYGEGGAHAIGGLGGGGSLVTSGSAATTNTGSGGGAYAGDGGSGIVIIRYRSGTSTTTYTHTPTSTTTLSTTIGTPSIELVRGTQGDSNTDYKIGNYNGDFIVKSSVSGVDSDYIRMLGTNGAIYNFTNSLYWTQTSDRRIKENIARASYDMCYDNIDKLELNRFNYIKEFNTGNKDTNQLGFIAQEIKEIFPKAVFTNNYSGGDLNIQDMLSIDIGQINYTLYGAVKKLMEINKDKEARLKRLEGLLNIEDSDGSSGNVVVDSSNAVVDISNFVVDTSNLLDTSSNITIDTSNLLDTPNITIDTSNILDTSSNIAIDTSNILDTPNIAIDTSNLLDTPNIAIDTSNLLDTSSNIVIDTINLLDTSSNI